jgi:hypothetical protein
MRAKTLIACLVTGLLTSSQSVRAASKRAAALTPITSFEHKQHTRQTHRPATLSQQAVSGVIPRAVRGGNPLQMLNPLAPAKYGTADESVSVDPDVPGKVNGIIFVSIPF